MDPSPALPAHISSAARRFGNLAVHGAHMAELLTSPWLVAGAQARSWHARYLDEPTQHYAILYDVTLIQRRGVEGFTVARVSDGHTESLSSGVAVSLATAVVWLGLDQIGHALAWSHEL